MKISYKKYSSNRPSASMYSPNLKKYDYWTSRGISGGEIEWTANSFPYGASMGSMQYQGLKIGYSETMAGGLPGAIKYHGWIFENIDTHEHLEDNTTPIFSDGTQRIVIDYCIFKNCKGLIANAKLGSSRVMAFRHCVIEDCDFSEVENTGFLFIDCTIKNCIIPNNTICANNCVIDKAYTFINGSYEISYLIESGNNIIGDPLYLSTDTADVWSNGEQMKDARGNLIESTYAINNATGIGYVPMAKWLLQDYDSPTYTKKSGIYPIEFSIVPEATTCVFQPSYSCNQTKKIVLLNNQNYIDLDGVQRNYFERAITEMSLDFSKNGLAKSDIESIKDIMENNNNEVTIYPFDNDNSHYLVGNLSKNDLEYSKIISSYWDSGMIDDERFNGIALTIRITDDTHFRDNNGKLLNV